MLLFTVSEGRDAREFLYWNKHEQVAINAKTKTLEIVKLILVNNTKAAIISFRGVLWSLTLEPETQLITDTRTNFAPMEPQSIHTQPNLIDF